MGAVHGVYLKYVGLSAISYACYAYATTYGIRLTSTNGGDVEHLSPSLLPFIVAAISGYSAILNASIAGLFKLERGMTLIGKDRTSGKIPWWSYLLFFPFHLPNVVFTYIHTEVVKTQR